MKLAMKLAALVPCALLATLVASNAGAEQVSGPAVSPIAINPATLGQFIQWTWVKGTIKVPASIPTGALAGMTCGDIVVSATSQAMNPPPPGGLFSSPKWVHTVHATGAISSGACSYAISVPPNQSFGVSLGGGAPNGSTIKCYLLELGSAPSQAGWFKVPLGGVKEQDFALTTGWCQNPPG